MMWHKHGPKKGEPRGFCFVELGDAQRAADAARALDGKLAAGRNLIVKFARNEEEATAAAAASTVNTNTENLGASSTKSAQQQQQQPKQTTNKFHPYNNNNNSTTKTNVNRFSSDPSATPIHTESLPTNASTQVKIQVLKSKIKSLEKK